MEIHYYDDPVEEPEVKRQKPRALFGVLLLCAGGLFLNTTLAANINISTGGKVEFGQGIAITTACSGSTALTVTPKASLENASGAGTFKFTSLTVSNIPASCVSKQFTFSAFDNNGVQATLFSGRKSLDVVGDGNIISVNSDVTGVTVSGSYNAQGVGTFTATFANSPALADSVTAFTLQSAEAGFQPKYVLGDTGPGGGTVYYVNYSGFSSPGAPCGTSCKYLEYAPKTWSGSSTDPDYQWSSNTSAFAVDIRNTFDEIGQRGLDVGNTAIGAGYMNTRNMLTTNATTGYTADTSGAAYRVSQYAGPKGTTVGQWHLPSYRELEFIQSYTMGRTGNPAGLIGWPNVGGGNRYWSSSEVSISESSSLRVENFARGLRTKSDLLWVRPVRVF